MRTFLAVALLAAALPVYAADGPKPCEQLRAEIAAKIDAAGVRRYALDIVAPDATGKRRVVGACESGSKRIVYERLSAPENGTTSAMDSRED